MHDIGGRGYRLHTALAVLVLVIGLSTDFKLAHSQTNEAEALTKQYLTLSNQGRYSEAIPLAQRVLAIREKSLGPNHPDVATWLNNLALLYENQGRYSDAEPLYNRSLAIREKALGPNHPDVAN